MATLWFADFFAHTGASERLTEEVYETGRTKAMLETTIEKWKQELIDEGRQEGRLEEKLQAARALKQQGIANEVITRATGLSAEEIASL